MREGSSGVNTIRGKWTNREGKTIPAGADAVAGNKVALTLHDGKKAQVLLSQLIDFDQRLLSDFFDLSPPPPPLR